MAHFQYKTKGVCSIMHEFDIENGKIYNFRPLGGCSGNLQAIGKLVEGMDAETVIQKLSGIKCGFKSTSCGDQLSIAIQKALNGELGNQ